MKKVCAVFICLVLMFSFSACNSRGGKAFKEGENKALLATDGTEYTFVGHENAVWCFGEQEHIGYVAGEKETFIHLANEIKTGVYSVNDSQDVVIRCFPENEFTAVYVKSNLLKTEIAVDNCVRFEFVKDLWSNKTPVSNSGRGITECEQFLKDIKNGLTAEDAGLYDLVKQPDGSNKNCYVCGYVCGIVQEDVNIVIPLEVMSFDDQAYSIKIDGTEYVLAKEWLKKLTTE